MVLLQWAWAQSASARNFRTGLWGAATWPGGRRVAGGPWPCAPGHSHKWTDGHEGGHGLRPAAWTPMAALMECPPQLLSVAASSRLLPTLLFHHGPTSQNRTRERRIHAQSFSNIVVFQGESHFGIRVLGSVSEKIWWRILV